MPAPELSGVAVVAIGAFNPAILHPGWLVDKALIPPELADVAIRAGQPHQLITSSQLTVFVADWLSVQITQEQAIFSTVDEARAPDLRDLVQGVLRLLPETPVDGLGINYDAHFQAVDQERWHTFGDKFMPKDYWEPLFTEDIWAQRTDGKHVGMRSMVVEVHRAKSELPAFVRIEVAPSLRVTINGVYIGINCHFTTSGTAHRGNARDAAKLLSLEWDESRTLETKLMERLSEEIA